MADGRVLLIFLQIEGAWVRLCKSRAGASPSGGGRRCKGKSFASGRGRRYKGISSAAWLRVLLQHAGAVHPCTARTKSPCSDVLRDRGGPGFGEAWQSRHRRSHGPSVGERRGGAGIGRKQAMDGLRSPVGAMDGGIRRCARSPHCRGSPEASELRRSSLRPDLASLQSGEEPTFGLPIDVADWQSATAPVPVGSGRRVPAARCWAGNPARRPVPASAGCGWGCRRRAGPGSGHAPT